MLQRTQRVYRKQKAFLRGWRNAGEILLHVAVENVSKATMMIVTPFMVIITATAMKTMTTAVVAAAAAASTR